LLVNADWADADGRLARRRGCRIVTGARGGQTAIATATAAAGGGGGGGGGGGLAAPVAATAKKLAPSFLALLAARCSSCGTGGTGGAGGGATAAAPLSPRLRMFCPRLRQTAKRVRS